MEKSLVTREFQVFTQLLRDTRTRAGVTQVQLAELLGQTQSYISKVERGECRLDIVQIRQFCRVLKTTLPDFVAEYETRLASRRGAAK
jgi:transcriptional regulator with XRE-family HTH domain